MDADRVLRGHIQAALQPLWRVPPTSAAILTSQVKNLQFSRHLWSMQAPLGSCSLQGTRFLLGLQQPHRAVHRTSQRSKYVDRKRVMELGWTTSGITLLRRWHEVHLRGLRPCVKALAPMGEGDWPGQKGLKPLDWRCTRPGKRSALIYQVARAWALSCSSIFRAVPATFTPSSTGMGRSLHRISRPITREITYSDYSIFVAEVACNGRCFRTTWQDTERTDPCAEATHEKVSRLAVP